MQAANAEDDRGLNGSSLALLTSRWSGSLLSSDLCSPPAPKLANRSQRSPGLQTCSLRMRPVAAPTERGPSNAMAAAPTGRRARGVFQTGLGRPAWRGSPHLPGGRGAGAIRPFIRACDLCVCCLSCPPEVSVWSSSALHAASALGIWPLVVG